MDEDTSRMPAAAPGMPPAPEPPEEMAPAPGAPVEQAYPPPPPPPPAYGPQAAPAASSDKNKIAAGVLAILLGALGVHKFYLGYVKEGAILLAVSVISFGMLAWVSSIIGLIEGIIYLTKTDEDFYATYVAGRKAWF